MKEGHRIFAVALLVCGVCSIIVSVTAVALKPLQVENRRIDEQRNILVAAGILHARAGAEEVRRGFARVRPYLVDLRRGRLLTAGERDAIRVEDYNRDAMLRDAQWHNVLSESEDIAGIKRREHYALIYRAQDGSLILPVRGYGLWSTLHGFIALREDLDTVIGLGFYAHGETPGLGGEVDNPKWRELWRDKRVYGAGQGGRPTREVALEVIKGRARADDPHRVDGLSGASITSRGVSNMLRYWLGREGFGPFLENLRNGEIRL